MDNRWLRRRLSILKGLHVSFIVILLCTGLVGLSLFTYIILQPIRACPVIFALYTTFWLCLGLSIFQVLLALLFLFWFLIALCQSKPNSSGQPSVVAAPVSGRATSQPSTRDLCPTPRTILHALGHSCTSCSRHQTTTGTEWSRMTAMGQSASSQTSLRSTHYPSVRGRKWKCQPRVGWLCSGAICLLLLSSGLILALILSINHTHYLDTHFPNDLVSVFVEATANFRGFSGPTQTSNTLRCWDLLHVYFHCCGLDGPNDWYNAGNNTTTSSVSMVPSSCICGVDCNAKSYDLVQLTGISEPVFSQGCQTHVTQNLRFKMHVTKVYLATGLGLIVVAFLLDFVYTLFTAYVTLVRTHQLLRGQGSEQPVRTDGTDISNPDVPVVSGRESSRQRRDTRYQIRP